MKYKWLLLLLLGNVLCYSQADLSVVAQDSWWLDQGTIEEAQFTLYPRGIYMEVGMYLTFSARSSNLEMSEQDLETFLRFQLPLGTLVTDSWLWINKDIIQADIEERWHATRIYEDIVGARLDPSLLTKGAESLHGRVILVDTYNLNVFPLQSDSTRRVKITYLTPGNWSDGKVTIPLPTDILRASRIPVDKISIQYFLNNEFSNPHIPQLPTKTFTPTTHATLGDHLQLLLTSKDVENNLDISLDVPIKNGVFLSNYQEEGRDYYQVAVLPKVVFSDEVLPPKNIAVLVDYDSISTTYSKETLLATLEELLITNLSPSDKFNILFSTPTGIQLINPNWLTAEDQTIQTVFNLIEEAYQFSEQSNIPQLLETGSEFINNQNQSGELLLLSCGQPFHEQEIADDYLLKINSIVTNNPTPIHIADYQNKNQSKSYYEFDWSDTSQLNLLDVLFYGNEYFYWKLREQTLGHHETIREQKNLYNLLEKSLDAIFNPIQEIETITISKSNGSCFNQYTLPKPSFFSTATIPFLQVGKCRGDFPFTIDVVASGNSRTVSKSIIINEPTTNKGAEDHIISWAGNYIYELEQNRPYSSLTQQILEEIIEWSLEYRVLSLYTAFLALEIELGGYVCRECVDETTLTQSITDLPEDTRNPSTNDVDLPTIAIGGEIRGGGVWIPPQGDSIITATKEVSLDTLIQITANPNPFQGGTTIEIQLPQQFSKEEIVATIYDLNGRVIQSFPTERLLSNSTLQFYWDGTTTQQKRLTAGMYIFSIQTRLGQQHLKLLLY